MTEVNKSAAVVLLPTTDEWCKQGFPHMTLVYVGDNVTSKSSVFNELLKVTYRVAMLTNPLAIKVSGVEVFGEEEKVDVLRMNTSPELLSVRGFFEAWDDGSYEDYKPHATIGPVGSWNPNLSGGWDNPSTHAPMYLVFDRICIWWGDEKTIFWLKK